MPLSIDDIKKILIKNIYRTDYLAPQLGSAVKQAIVDQIFSRTVLVGKESVRLSFSDLSKLTGISTVTISRAMKDLIKQGVVRIVSEYKPKVANEYSLNIPENLTSWMSIQRDPYIVFRDITETEEKSYQDVELTEEGQAIVNSIKDSMTQVEKELYRKRAREELSIEGKPPTEANIDKKITEIIIRGFSDDKKERYIKRV